MLSLKPDSFTNEPRLYIACERGEAWIVPRRRRDLTLRPDWELWVRYPGDAARRSKSPLKLAIESHLRAWVLQHYHRPLSALTFAELCHMAEGHPR